MSCHDQIEICSACVNEHLQFTCISWGLEELFLIVLVFRYLMNQLTSKRVIKPFGLPGGLGWHTSVRKWFIPRALHTDSNSFAVNCGPFSSTEFTAFCKGTVMHL